MVQLMVDLLHPREQGSAQRLSPVCQRWYSRSSDGVVVTHSIKYNMHGPFLNAFELVCLFVSNYAWSSVFFTQTMRILLHWTNNLEHSYFGYMSTILCHLTRL